MKGVVLVALAALAAVLALLAAESTRPGEPRVTGEPVASPPDEPEQPDEVDALMAEHESIANQLAETLRSSLTTRSTSLDSHETQPIDDDASDAHSFEWPGDYPRSRFDLVRYAAKSIGRMRFESLVRHADLNPGDVPLTPADVEAFARLVAELNARLSALRRSYRDIRRAEMIQAIEAGRIAPYEPEPRTSDDAASGDESLRSLAEAYATARGVPLEQAIEAIRARRIHTMNDSAIVHRGAAYLMRDFDELPTTERAFEVVRYFAREATLAIGAWFVRRGLVSDRALVEALGAHEALTLRSVLGRGK